MGHRLLITALIVFIGCSILASILQGGGGIVSTVLAENIWSNSTTVTVDSTELFTNQDIIRIGDEKVLYSSKTDTTFTVGDQGRGYDDTTASDHEAGRQVYSTEAGVLNDAFGFNLGVSVETGGVWGIVMLPINFFIHTLPHLAVLNANLLVIPELAVIGIFWWGFGIALIVVAAKDLAPIAISIALGVFGLVRR